MDFLHCGKRRGGRGVDGPDRPARARPGWGVLERARQGGTPGANVQRRRRQGILQGGKKPHIGWGGRPIRAAPMMFTPNWRSWRLGAPLVIGGTKLGRRPKVPG